MSLPLATRTPCHDGIISLWNISPKTLTSLRCFLATVFKNSKKKKLIQEQRTSEWFLKQSSLVFVSVSSRIQVSWCPVQSSIWCKYGCLQPLRSIRRKLYELTSYNLASTISRHLDSYPMYLATINYFQKLKYGWWAILVFIVCVSLFTYRSHSSALCLPDYISGVRIFLFRGCSHFPSWAELGSC